MPTELDNLTSSECEGVIHVNAGSTQQAWELWEESFF